ncbi:phosphonoacetate hydrolase [Rhodococcus spongiicola]|uniref:Phosphonoacetate hydrolase n=1 Tax=Rhodococcus spongiicola TaxID=2487352 RepID=A0A438B1D0_9NOCA|nr:phosphonoacetate hydrolase [Rhodococcus spongiicola]RVW04763.1 phosphonoacetate hydrolase [Rhodococcus spongiicola]
MSRSFSVNGREYEVSDLPVVVICIDGSEPEYHQEAIEAGRMPWLEATLVDGGTYIPAHCAMPALTNPNNVSIATGRPPKYHGISGNYIFDTATGEEVLMNDKKFLRIPSIFAAANEAGLDVAVVTAKDKLRRLLGAGLVEEGPNLDGTPGMTVPSRRGICFSAEKADEATVEANGIGDVLAWVDRPLPAVYSADLSEFALAAGVKILETRKPDLMYLTLTDFIQHKHAPGTEVANAFYEMIDRYASELDALGAIVVVTADHGMSAKSLTDGTPRVIFVEDEVKRILAGLGASPDGVRVILPITDPYTVHHGALGSFASVYLPAGADVDAVSRGLAGIDGIEAVHERQEAADRYELPADRIGDLVVLAEKNTAVGRFAEWHDLTQLDAPLRSHGALGELKIPFVINRKLEQPEPVDTHLGDGTARIHNYDAFWVATTALSRRQNTHTTPV